QHVVERHGQHARHASPCLHHGIPGPVYTNVGKYAALILLQPLVPDDGLLVYVCQNAHQHCQSLLAPHGCHPHCPHRHSFPTTSHLHDLDHIHVSRICRHDCRHPTAEPGR